MKIIEFIGETASGKTTAKSKMLASQPSYIDSDKLIKTFKYFPLKIIYYSYVTLYVMILEHTLFFKTCRFLFKYRTVEKESVNLGIKQRIFTLIKVLYRLHKSKRTTVFCEGYIKQIKRVYQLRNGDVDSRDINNLIDAYFTRYPMTEFVFLNATAEERLKRIKKRRRKTDKMFLYLVNPLITHLIKLERLHIEFIMRFL